MINLISRRVGQIPEINFNAKTSPSLTRSKICVNLNFTVLTELKVLRN